MGGPGSGGGGGLKRKRSFERRWRRTKRRYKNGKKDIDQVQDDIKSIKRNTYKPEQLDIDKPGMGQFKCIICCRYFINSQTLKIHKKSKKHKQMIKKVGRPQYTQREADLCGGLGRVSNESKKHNKLLREKISRNQNAFIKQTTNFKGPSNQTQIISIDQ